MRQILIFEVSSTNFNNKCQQEILTRKASGLTNITHENMKKTHSEAFFVTFVSHKVYFRSL